MKKLIILFFFYGIVNNGYAQITLTGANTYAIVNNSYLLNNNYSTQPFTGIGIKDFNTNSYKFIDTQTNDAYWLVRKNNYWTIEKHFQGGGVAVGLLYKSVSTSNDADPPCNVIWGVWAGVWYSYGTGGPSNTGNQESAIVLNGGCTCTTSYSTEVNPTNVRLANLTTSDYSSILNPQRGMLNYNTCQRIPKVYDGLLWQEILLNKNTNLNGWLSVNGSVSLPITFPISLSQYSVTMDETDNTFVNISSNIFSVSIPAPHTCKGRHYYLINHGSQNMNVSRQIKTGYSTQTNLIQPQERFHIVSDGTYWHKAN
jgi:hypothetical protein